ncbi:MAG: class I SAM-dependent methyltransferase [Proteobacteria bacterium]|nr:class I SAM-dependent methyltransferase [Pseudomonadota bacterium]
MRKLLNRLLIKFGILITKAPLLLSNQELSTSDSFPVELTEKIVVETSTKTPQNELFDIFSSDTDVHKWHHYFDIYAKHFEQYRDRPIRMLEIGVFRGGSLRMWKNYFHADSTIVGIDIDKSCKAHEIADKNVFVRIGSQADPHFLNKVNAEFGPFDIILDDGSHKTHHQIISFGTLFRSALQDGGCYMVEDTHSNYWLKHVDSDETFIDLAKQMIDMLHEPYLGRKETNFRQGHVDAVAQIELSYLSANLSGIAFYDSIVVFDKRKHFLPKNELR